MAALLEKYRKVAGTGPGSTINLDDWNGLIDELSTTLAGLVKKGADFDAVATVAIGVLLDRINNVLGPAYDQVAARGAQIEALYAQISGTGISANSVIESATRLFLTDARRAAILAELRGGVPSDGDTLMELYTAIQAAFAAIQALPGDVVRHGTAQTLSSAARIQAKANIGALGTGRAYTNAPLQVTKAHVGKVIYCDSATTFINFDNSSTFANGDLVIVFCNGADLNVNADASDTYSFNFGFGGYPKTFRMKMGDRAILHMGEDHWQVVAYSTANGMSLLADRAQSFTASQKAQLAANLGLPASFRNRIINGNLAINQRGAAAPSTAYSAGAYIMDRWKAGANGVTLSFSTAANGDVTVSITAGTLVQIIEGTKYLPEGGGYALSWTGSATARVYQGAASGSYAASPIVASGLTAGTNTTVEFSTGTLGLVQFEPGSTSTAFERRDDELYRCARYAQLVNLALRYNGGGDPYPTVGFNFAPTMRATPSVVNVVAGTFNNSGSVNAEAATSAQGGLFQITGPSGADVRNRVNLYIAEL